MRAGTIQGQVAHRQGWGSGSQGLEAGHKVPVFAQAIIQIQPFAPLIRQPEGGPAIQGQAVPGQAAEKPPTGGIAPGIRRMGAMVADEGRHVLPQGVAGLQAFEDGLGQVQGSGFVPVEMHLPIGPGGAGSRLARIVQERGPAEAPFRGHLPKHFQGMGPTSCRW